MEWSYGKNRMASALERLLEKPKKKVSWRYRYICCCCRIDHKDIQTAPPLEQQEQPQWGQQLPPQNIILDFLGLPLPLFCGGYGSPSAPILQPPSVMSVSCADGISNWDAVLEDAIGLSSTPDSAVLNVAPTFVKFLANLRKKLSFLNKLSVFCFTKA